MANPSWLETAARRSGQHVWTLGHVFEQYRKHEGLSPEALATQLGCSLEVLHWLSLCRRPDEGELFATHVQEVAKRFSVDPHRLAAVVRHAEVLEALSARTEGAEATSGNYLLLAARDRPCDDETSS